MCGATHSSSRETRCGRGLSPRVWGNRDLAMDAVDLLGSIPTCVGQPDTWIAPVATTEVYPHVCGATTTGRAFAFAECGLSPRVWGNRNDCCRSSMMTGSIPTCVGQPELEGTTPDNLRVYPHVCGATPHRRPAIRNQTVYPHVCGATTDCVQISSPGTGLSPRVWGNPDRYPRSAAGYRSIPTCVGQPVRASSNARFVRVYPHVCGATSFF